MSTGLLFGLYLLVVFCVPFFKIHLNICSKSQQHSLVMRWHLVAGAMEVRWEWVGVRPPRCPLSPLVNCWLAGLNVPPLTAGSETTAAHFRHICTLVFTSNRFTIFCFQISYRMMIARLYLWFNGIHSAVHVCETGTVQTFCEKERQKSMSLVIRNKCYFFFRLFLSFWLFPFLSLSSWHHQ